MLRPTVGELLAGVRTELAATVLPVLPAGAEARQLKAALHVLGQVAATWDRQQTTLDADNADIDATLDLLCARTGLVREPVAAADTPFPGVHDEELRAAMARNAALQQELEAFQGRLRRDPRAESLLLELHLRTTARAEGAA